MKIAFLNLYSGVNNRGAESFTHELAKRLEKVHQVDFYTGLKAGVKIVQPEHRRSWLKLIFLDSASLSVLVFTLKIFKDLWRGGYDWLIPMNGFWEVLVCKFIFKSKILITGHSGPGWDERWNLYLKPDAFVATTEPAAVWARKTCWWTRVVVIPYGIDSEKYQSDRPGELGLEKPIILCPAAAVPYKRVDLTISAVAAMKNGSLLYLGDGELREKLVALGKTMLGKRFQSRSVGHDDMPKYYASCDIVTLSSSEQENSPMVFLEAMAAGKPIVATDTPRNRWIIGEAGLLVDPTKTGEYAKELMEAQGIGKEKIQKQAEKYSLEKIATFYNRLLESLK